MMLTASAIVMTSTTFSSTWTTYSRLLKLSLCSITRYLGGFFFFVSFLQAVHRNGVVSSCRRPSVAAKCVQIDPDGARVRLSYHVLEQHS